MKEKCVIQKIVGRKYYNITHQIIFRHGHWIHFITIYHSIENSLLFVWPLLVLSVF
jgi:hypothetical protein